MAATDVAAMTILDVPARLRICPFLQRRTAVLLHAPRVGLTSRPTMEYKMEYSGAFFAKQGVRPRAEHV